MPGYRNILVRSVNRVGDTLFMLPSIKALKTAFPVARITVLSKPIPSELFKNNKEVDGVILFEDKGRHKGITGRLRLIRELRREKFDLAVIYHNCFDAALVPFLAGIPERIGYVKEGRKPLLTRSLPFPDGSIHMVEHFLRVLSLIGINAPFKNPELVLSGDELAKARSLFEGNGLRKPVIGLVPGSVAPTRRWFPERFAEAADRLVERTGGSIVILGGPGDRAISGQISSLMKSAPVDLTGKLGLRELMAVFTICDLVISNDTGPMHLAAVLGRPVVTFIDVADIRKTRPLGDKVRVISKRPPCAPCIKEECPQGTLECLKAVTVEEVYNAALEMLNTGGI